MNVDNKHNPITPHANGIGKDKYLNLQYIKNQIEKGTGLSLKELKNSYSEEYLFYVSLKYITTTKKALCTVLEIPIEAGCRYKRTLEKNGYLVQSIDEVVCPFTRCMAHLLTTNPKEFEKLTNSNQLKLF
ncbi:hypothetical protein [Flavicella sp.]|uniref:hypothetical protein n=1 Tax=Flavicella sp. TaxID=2957742 RepID=UPI00301A3B6E